MTSNEVALLSQQLQGIMECWDMNNLFYLLKMPQLYKYHKHRLAKLVNIHQYTNCIMVKRYNEIGEIPYAYKSQLKLPIDSNMERSSKRNLINAVLDSWVKWIDSIKELYIQLIKTDEEYKPVWTKLYLQIQRESADAQKFHTKFYSQPKTRTVRMEMKAKLDAVKNTLE